MSTQYRNVSPDAQRIKDETFLTALVGGAFDDLLAAWKKTPGRSPEEIPTIRAFEARYYEIFAEQIDLMILNVASYNRKGREMLIFDAVRQRCWDIGL